MHIKQKTIYSSLIFSGSGLHSGKPVTMELHPAPVNHGISFQRTDIEGGPIIAALADYVSDTQRGTTIQNEILSVSTIEHILSALYGLGVDNILIKLGGPEVPILDGSSKHYVEEILKRGIIEQNANRKYFCPKKSIYYIDKESGTEITVLPDDGFSIDLMIDFNSEILGKQQAKFDEHIDYAVEVAPSRTFVFLHDVLPLMKSNLIKGGDLKNAIVIIEKPIPKEDFDKISEEYIFPDADSLKIGYLNPNELRYPNECARHKLLDLIGDLSLTGFRIKAKIIANKPGHKINTIIAKMMRKEALENFVNEIPKFDPNKEPVIDINGIKKLLPHRPPFLMVDRVIDITTDSIVGIKNIGVNEGFFVGHFPDEPVMPGVLIVEAMAQVGGILVMTGLDEPEKYSTYFAKIDKVKFKRKVVPGDVLVIKIVYTAPLRRSIVCMRGEVYVGDKLACEGEMVAQVIKNK